MASAPSGIAAICSTYSARTAALEKCRNLNLVDDGFKMARIIEAVHAFWLHIATAVTFAAMLWTAVHVILHKRDTKAATGWVGLIWFSPLLGLVLYWLFGINRIRRRARARLAGKEKIPLPELYGLEIFYILPMFKVYKRR